MIRCWHRPWHRRPWQKTESAQTQFAMTNPLCEDSTAQTHRSFRMMSLFLSNFKIERSHTACVPFDVLRYLCALCLRSFLAAYVLASLTARSSRRLRTDRPKTESLVIQCLCHYTSSEISTLPDQCADFILRSLVTVAVQAASTLSNQLL